MVQAASNYKVLSDEYIESLFRGTNFGEPVNSSTKEKTKLIKTALKRQLEGYWTGHTLYHILVNGRFLYDAKTTEQKRLTQLGVAFLQCQAEG